MNNRISFNQTAPPRLKKNTNHYLRGHSHRLSVKHFFDRLPLVIIIVLSQNILILQAVSCPVT
jgi:hypothetical protein